MAKGTVKGTGALPKTAAPATSAPKITGSVSPAPRPGQKQAAGPSADVVGDICLIPDIARFAH